MKSHRSRVRLLIVPPLVAHVVAIGCALSPPDAHATPGSPLLDVWVERWTGPVATVCAEGKVDDGAAPGGEWALSTVGVRSNGSAIAGPSAQSSGATFARTCFDVTAGGAASTFTVQLAFGHAFVAAPAPHDGAAAEPPSALAEVADLAGLAGLTVEWTATTGPTAQTYSTGR